MPTAVTYQSCAKINLYLDVLERREDNYHNIETVFQTVDLVDTLAFELRPRGISMECSNPELDCGEDNLVCRAARLLLDLGGSERGVHVRLTKRIPVAAGLAGGSGNAAAALTALNELWGLHLEPARLHALGMLLGADVPYCLAGGPMAATLRGDSLAPLPPLPQSHFVLLHPPIRVSTPSVFNSPLLRHNSEERSGGRTASFCAALRALEEGDLGRAVFNAMEVPVFEWHPELAEAKARLVKAGCVAAAMSGSGPTLFGVCRSCDHAAGVAAEFPDYAVSVVSGTDQALRRLS